MRSFRARAVFFDLDNTLFDHQASTRAGVADLLASMGRPDSDCLQRVWTELEGQYFQQYLKGLLSFQDQRRARMRSFLRSAGISVSQNPGTLDDWFATYTAAARSAWAAFPDAAATLRRLRGAGLGLAVLSNGNQGQQVDKLQSIGLAELVDVVFTSDEIGHAKPDPEAFLIPCRALGMAPGEVLHVGDDPVADVAGSRRAALQGILLDRSGTAGDSAVHSLADLHVQR